MASINFDFAPILEKMRFLGILTILKWCQLQVFIMAEGCPILITANYSKICPLRQSIRPPQNKIQSLNYRSL